MKGLLGFTSFPSTSSAAAGELGNEVVQREEEDKEKG